MRTPLLITLVPIFLLTACGMERQVEHYPDMAGLTALTATNHAHGYKQTNCFTCHVVANIHQDDRSTGIAGFAKMAQESVTERGLNSCADCHGGPSGFFNGVPQE